MNIFTKSYKLTLVFLFLTNFVFCSNIAIIESQSFHALQIMDDNWQAIANDLGHSTTILPQSTLDNANNLTGYDILIISNGLISLSSNRENTIEQFLMQGGNVYIQAEYLASQPGSKVFANIVNNTGSNFSWDGEMNGNLIPMNVIGDVASNFLDVSAVDHFWYGAYGSGSDNIIPILEFDNKHFGFIYCPTNIASGKMITTSDQDWMRLGYAENLAKNIISYLDAGDNFTVPSVFVSVSNTQPCENEPITFIANVGNTSATITYQWNVNGIAVAGANNASFTSVFNDGDLVNCTITFTQGCGTIVVNTPDLEVLTIFPLTLPSLDIQSLTTTLCEGDMIEITATATNTQGLNNVSYQWQLNNQNIAGATNTTIETNTLNDGDIISCQLHFSDPCNGANQVTSDPISFTVNPVSMPTLAISADLTNICAGEEVTFTATGTFLGNAPTYQWQVDGINIGTDSPVLNSNSFTSGQVVTCIVISNNTCTLASSATSNGVTINVTQPATPVVNILASTNSICEGESVTFQATGTYLGFNPQYQWQINGTNVGNNNNIFTTTSLTENQSVTCWVVTDETCVTTTSVESAPVVINVTTYTAPTVEITAPQTVVCEGGSITFTAIGDNLGTNPQYQWMINGTTTGNNSSILNTTFNTEQTVSCIVTTLTDCGGQTSITSNEIEVTIGNITLEVVDIQHEKCNLSNGALIIEATGGVAPYSYHWDNNNNTNTNELTNLSAGNYSVVATDANGCTSSTMITITSSEGPSITQLETNHINCNTSLGGSAKVIMEDENRAYFYEWKNADEEVIANTQEVQNLQEGLYFVEVTDVFGCSISEEVYIEPAAPLFVEILEETKIQLGQEIQLTAVTNATDATFLWQSDETLSCADCMTPIAKPTETATYFLTITTAEGCSAQAHVTIWVEKTRDVFVPNAFSPNNDGNNDRFAIYGGEDVAKVKSLKIFNRWGEVVFANNDFDVNDESQGWEGKINNKEISNGVFIYVAEIEFVDGQSFVYKGDVTITH